jgi:hypothetical protein
MNESSLLSRSKRTERGSRTPWRGGGEFQQVQWNGAPATQLSRRSNNRIQDLDTAAIKLNKVLAWIRSR